MSNKVEYVKDTFREYLMKEDCISVEDLIAFMQSPRTYFYSKNKPQGFDTKNNTFSLAVALYEYIMNRDLFNHNYIVSPKFDKRTKAGKEAFTNFMLQAGAKQVISESEMQTILQTSICVQMNPTFMDLLEESEYDLSAYTADKKTKLNVKLRPNILNRKKNTELSVIGCIDGSPTKFFQDVKSEHYDLIAAYSMDFLGTKQHLFAAIEENPPYQVGLYQLPEEIIEQGRAKYRMVLDLMKWSIDNNFWCDFVEFEFLKDAYRNKKLARFKPHTKKMKLIYTLEND